jgi:HEAT repeat protein
MTKVCRNILIWAVSVAAVIPVTALEGQAGLKPSPMVGLGLATLQEPAAPAPPAALSAPAADASGAEPSNVQDADEKRERDREQEAQNRDQEAQQREQEARDRAQEQIDRERELYEQGTELLDEGKLQLAIDRFNHVIEGHGAHAEGALYWKAYVQNRLGQRPDALETLETLRRTYPKSRWLDDAKALEVEVRQSSGQHVSPEAEGNEDLKLIAINSLLGTDPEQALPMLEKFLNGPQSLKLKERALFVLSQSGSPKAHEIVARIASGNRNPELQMKAIRDLGLFGGKESRATLEEIYKSSHDTDVKRVILQSFMISGERERLLEVAKSEQSPELRGEAVKQLGVMGGRSELYQLYQNETSTEVKKKILQAMFVGGDVEHMLGLARTEKDSELRRQAVRNLGLMGKDKTAAALVSIYNSDKDPEIKRAVILAFFQQGNAKPLIEIARQEKDMSMKKDAVQKLSLMHSKESTDFMMELLNK